MNKNKLVTTQWATQDDLHLLDRCGTGSISLRTDDELSARVRTLRPEVAAIILDSELDFVLSSEDAPLASNDLKGNICQIHRQGNRLHFILGAEVRTKIENKHRLNITESTLQRLITSWLVFAYSLETNRTKEQTFYLDFSDLAQHSSPCLAFCSNRDSDCLIPDPFFLRDFGYTSLKRKLANAPPWEERKSQLFWRGASSGLGPFSGTDRYYYTGALSGFTFSNPIDIGFTSITPRAEQTISPQEKSMLNDRGLLKERVLKSEFANYRYLLDIDGNSNSWGGLFSNLLTGSVVVKCESRKGFKQWYYPQLKSMENCFILQADLRNLHELDALMNGESNAKEIAGAGEALAKSLTAPAELERCKPILLGWLEEHAK